MECLLLSTIFLLTQLVRVDGYVAFIDDAVILQSELTMEREFLLSPLISTSISPAEITDDFLLNRLIDRYLLNSEAQKFLTIDPGKVTLRFGEISDRVGGELKMKSILETILMSELEFKRRVREDLIIESYIEERIRSFIQIPAKTVDDYIKSHRSQLDIPQSKKTTKDDPQMRQLKKSISKLLKEEAVNQRLTDLVSKLRKEHSIKIISVQSSDSEIVHE
jgi:hypothetical protein